MGCDLCGKEGNLVYAYIEGVKLHVCDKCAKHGKIVSSNNFSNVKTVKPVKREEAYEDVNNDYSDLIREAILPCFAHLSQTCNLTPSIYA